MIDLAAKEKEILGGLKDFQLATVNRVDYLFKGGYHRVLVADEVGLGKTLVAKGIIAKMARYYREEAGRELFKVVYVCSNQSIAGQNLKKLKVHQDVKVDGLSGTRLSMQHLKIFQQMHDPAIKEAFVQLIPLTPGTSFSMTGGTGSVDERALIFALLKRIPFFKGHSRPFKKLMIATAVKSWPGWARYYQGEVNLCNRKSKGKYLEHVLEKVTEGLEADPELLELAETVFASIKKVGYRGTVGAANRLIMRLRKLMAEISVEMLDADLVIMDEFQRFPELIKLDADSETALLARKFFNPGKVQEHQPRILLLSATPYKLYSTLEEIQENRKDEHYKEFMEVIEFLFEHHEEQRLSFKTAWKNYSMALKEATYRDRAVVLAGKEQAEESLYNGVCRTERMKVPGADNLVELERRNGSLKVHEDDLLSYADLDKAMEELGLKGIVPVEYIKSAPLIMSFMQKYKLKQKLMEEVRARPEGLPLLQSPRLWVNRNKVAKYKPLAVNHARYNKLKEVALPAQGEKLLWVPPSRPYYEPGGPFRGQEGFSKTLVFSAWEMVPRAVAALLSYEAERLTVGKLVTQTPNPQRENRSYFARKRFPGPRINFNVKNNLPDNMNHLCLLYPSVSLAGLYDPVEAMNRKLSLKAIRKELRAKVRERLAELAPYVKRQGRRDERWYYMAPLLMDKGREEIAGWLENPMLQDITKGEEGLETGEGDKKGLLLHLEQLRSLFHDPEGMNLGAMPRRELEEVLVNMAMASPAVCALRMLGVQAAGAVELALQLAKTIVDRFNTQEAIAMVDLSYGKAGEGVHWKSVLKYCLDGNLQAVLDEYAHMLMDAYNIDPSEQVERNNVLTRDMIQSLKTHTASYNVDTFRAFSQRAKGGGSDGRQGKGKGKGGGGGRQIRMRSSYAVGFYDTRDEGKSRQRKDKIRLSFNSPFRPFVLATTSIGQEGLDFHYYCRNIVHWNLPANPVDLEQREGRINRYKCHAIRQNIAHKYGGIRFGGTDIWREMFAEAQRSEKKEETSDLVPFWCLPEDKKGQQLYKIQRVVPIYPMSRDLARYERLMKILSLYRLSLGQARQEELIEYLFESGFDGMGELFMNLSPYFRE